MKAVSSFFLVVTVALLYFIVGNATLALIQTDGIVTVGIFPPEGIALAFSLYFGYKTLAGIFIGQFALAYANALPLSVALEIAAVNSLEAAVAIYLVQKLRIDLTFSSFRDVTMFAGLVAFVLQPLSALLGNAFLLLHGIISQNDFLYLSFAWWFGNTLGQLVWTPFLLLLFRRIADKTIRFQEMFLLGSIFAFYIYFLTIVFAVTNPFLLTGLSLIVIIVVLAKKDLFYGTFFGVITATIALFSLYLQVGAFSNNSPFENTINFNLFVLLQVAIVWLVGILFEERRNIETALQRRIQEEVAKNQEQQLFMLQQNRLAQMGEMIGMIAHQWRQPLNNLALITQIVANKYDKNALDDKTMIYFKENAKKQIDLMSKTIDDFRNFFKSDRQKHEFCVYEIIDQVLHIVDPIFKKHHIHITLESSYPDYIVYGYGNSLSQALLSIVNNAKDVLLERDIDYKKITITLEKYRDQIIVSIEDNAGGIDAAIIDKIFDPYFSTKDEKNGTGLGLYMAKSIVEDQMHGRLSVENTECGARFTITLKGATL